MTELFTTDAVDQYLFREGLVLSDYWIERIPVSEVICYKNREGRSFDLLISDDGLASLAKQRLLALGVKLSNSRAERINVHGQSPNRLEFARTARPTRKTLRLLLAAQPERYAARRACGA